MKDNSYRDYIVEDILGHINGITDRSMFSGWGIYLDKVIVGIIAEGELYLKSSKDLVEKYKKEGMYSFTYKKSDDKSYEMSYMSVPLDVLEDRYKIKDRIMESYSISIKNNKK